MSDLTGILHRLHGLDPGEFVAARNEAAAGLSGADARRVKALRRPTAAAWAVNRLVRERPEPVEALADLGDRMREAQASGDVAAMRDLDKERRRRTAEAVAIATEVAGGLQGSAREGVEATLRAVVLDPDAATAVLEGNLSTALSASAFATVSSGSSGRPRPAPRRRRSKDDTDARLEEARRQLERARRELAEADEEAEEAEEARDDAAEAADEAAGRLERVRAELADAEHAHAEAAEALARSDRELDAAREQSDAAALAVASAERDLAELEKGAG